MNHTAALKGVILSLACAATILACSPSGKPTALKTAAGDKSLALSISGAEANNMVSLKIKNNGKTERRILVPMGTVLPATNKDQQSMLLAGETEIVLAPEEEKTVDLPAFSMSYYQPVAGIEDSYAVKSGKPTRDPSLKKILAYLASDSGKADYPADKSESLNVAQQAVWLVTDGIGYDVNIGHIIDSMIFASILQVNPMAITVMADEGTEITDDASAEKAVYDLVMDKKKLHEKLQTVLGEDFDSAVETIRGGIETEAGPEYRKSVNDFIDKAGMEKDY